MEAGPIIAGLIGLLGATWSAMIAGFFRGDLIPGHVYRREVKRGDTATTQAERNAQAVSGLTQELRDLTQELRKRPNAPTT